jgi:hypothetical protein
MNVIDSNILERDAGGKPLHTFPHPALGCVEIQDFIAGSLVIQACDGTLGTDGRPMGEDGTALSG